MGFGKAIFVSVLLLACGSVASRAAAPETKKPAQPACYSMMSLAQSLATDGRGLAITHLMKGEDAKPWVTEVGRKTGAKIAADEVATVEGRGISPLVMLIFANGGCAQNVVTIRIIPDIAI